MTRLHWWKCEVFCFLKNYTHYCQCYVLVCINYAFSSQLSVKTLAFNLKPPFFGPSEQQVVLPPRKLLSLVVTDVFLDDWDFVLILLFESLELKLLTRCFQNDLVSESELLWAIKSSKVLPSDFRYSEKRENSELQRIIEEGSEGSSSKTSLEGLQLRFLTPYDIDEVRLLCEESFPIEYPLSWWVQGNCAKSQLFNANDIDSL